MTTYRLKPLIVHAAQFTGEITPELRAMADCEPLNNSTARAYLCGRWHTIGVGCWLVKLAPASMVEIMSEELFDSLVEVVE